MQQQVDVLRALCPLRRHQHAVHDLRGANDGDAEMSECGTACEALTFRMSEAPPRGPVDWHPVCKAVKTCLYIARLYIPRQEHVQDMSGMMNGLPPELLRHSVGKQPNNGRSLTPR